MDREELTSTPAPDLFGRLVGFLTTRPNGDPCFILLGRTRRESDFDHLFAFYVHAKCKVIQKSEYSIVASKFKPRIAVSKGVINLVSQMPRVYDLSLLVQTVGFMVSPSLITRFVPYQVINSRRGIRFRTGNSNVPNLPQCNASIDSPSIASFTHHQFQRGIRVYNVALENLGSTNREFHILIVDYRGHCYFLIKHKAIKIITILLPHASMFSDEDYMRGFLRQVASGLKDLKHYNYYPSRFYGDPKASCDEGEILNAVLLEFYSYRNPLHVILRVDLLGVGLRDNPAEPLLASIASDAPSDPQIDEMNEILSQQSDLYDDSFHSAEGDEEVPQMEVSFDGPYGSPQIISNNMGVDSQETVIMSQRQLDELVEVAHRFPALRSRLESLVPPVAITITPRNDLTGGILKDKVVIAELLEKMTYLLAPMTESWWLGIASFADIAAGRHKFELRRGVRFQFLLVDRGTYYDVIIIDVDAKELTILFGSQPKGGDVAARIMSILNSCCKQTDGMRYKMVKMTSQFHPELPGIHQVMSLYYLAKIFRHSVELPQKIIYSEREFRRLCYDICVQLQLANLKYNQERGYVSTSGNLSGDAFRSIESPVKFQRSVVPIDQCPICLKRYFKNLGSHMTADHGKGGAYASHSRFT